MMKLSNKMDEIKIEDVSVNMASSCIYLMKNLHNGKVYIGKAIDAVHRIAGHYYSLRKGTHVIREMQEDFNAGNEFEIKTLCSFNKKDHDRKTKALETFFILQYDGVEKGYNATYNYPSANRAYEIIEDNAEYIISCLRKQGIRFKMEIFP
ncbi:MAG: GIY-YIG nuclease family protein [Lachnospiraceae bacterium]|nr:GIY-YIG nuclease family protein [Lachnospiraceae bacterium]